MASSPSNVSSPWRVLAVLFVVLAIMGGVMGFARVFAPALALDLAGGTTVTLRAVTPNGKPPSETSMTLAQNIMRNRVNGFGISEADVTKQGSDLIIVSVPGEGQRKVLERIGTTAQLEFRQVLVTEQVAAPTPPTSPSPSPSPSGKDKDKGDEDKATPSPSPAATPSASPKGRALSQALTQPSPPPGQGQPAQPGQAPGSGAGQPSNPAGGGLTPEQMQQLQQQLGQQGQQGQQPGQQPDFTGIDPATVQEYQKLDCSKQGRAQVQARTYPTDKPIALCDRPDPQTGQSASKYILGPVKVSGQQLTSAQAVPPDPSGQGTTEWIVSLSFNSAGASAFAGFTAQAAQIAKTDPKNRFGIILDNQVVSAPTVNEPIPSGQAQITGMSGQAEATDLAGVLKYGSLPLKFQQQSVDQVSSTLGADQLRGGLLAGAIGLGLVVIFSMLYYRGLGIVSIFSLVVAAALTYGSVVLLSKYAGFRLSLAHIIGLVVSIGITADSFIIYFERLRDELRAGKTLRSGVESAWVRARRTIMVADAVTIIAALVLYFLAVGGVQGFAFAMGLTTLIDILVVVMFTKPLVALFARTNFFGKGHKLSGLDPDRLRRSAPAAATRRPQSQEARA